MTDVSLLQIAVAGARAQTPKAVSPLALNKGRTLALLVLALGLRHNRKSRRTLFDVRAAWDRVRSPRWLIVLQKQPFSPYNILRVLTYPKAERATGASYRGTMTQTITRKLAMAGECISNAPTISELATAQAAHIWGSFDRQQIALCYDKYRRCIRGVGTHIHDKSLNVTAVAVWHTIEYHNT